ncbi:MAG: hypothetical protein RR774_05400 [Acinetobacter sp.]
MATMRPEDGGVSICSRQAAQFIENLLRHQRENQELQAMQGGEPHTTASLEHENLRGPGYYH